MITYRVQALVGGRWHSETDHKNFDIQLLTQDAAEFLLSLLEEVYMRRHQLDKSVTVPYGWRIKDSTGKVVHEERSEW